MTTYKAEMLPFSSGKGCNHDAPGGSDSPTLGRRHRGHLLWAAQVWDLDSTPPTLVSTLPKKKKATGGSGARGPGLQFPLGFYQQPFCIARCTPACVALQRRLPGKPWQTERCLLATPTERPGCP